MISLRQVEWRPRFAAGADAGLGVLQRARWAMVLSFSEDAYQNLKIFNSEPIGGLRFFHYVFLRYVCLRCPLGFWFACRSFEWKCRFGFRGFRFLEGSLAKGRLHTGGIQRQADS